MTGESVVGSFRMLSPLSLLLKPNPVIIKIRKLNCANEKFVAKKRIILMLTITEYCLQFLDEFFD